MFATAKKVLGLLLLVCIASAPLACVTVNKEPEHQTKDVTVIKEKEPEHKTEVNVNKAPENQPKTEVHVNN